MGERRSSMRIVVAGVLVVGLLGGAYAAGRSTVKDVGTRNPLAVEHGIPIGVVESPVGALAAADNYAAVGVTADLGPGEQHAFIGTVIDPGVRSAFSAADQAVAQREALPVGAHMIGSVLAHRLESYSAGVSDVSVWELASEWDGGVVPTQYWALVELSLRWNADRWQVTRVRELLPGLVPALIAGGRDARSTAVWDQTLAGMSAPYYGDR